MPPGGIACATMMSSRKAAGILVAFACSWVALVAGAKQAANTLDSAPSRFARVDGIRVHYKNVGTGETALVFVHGWTCDLTFWRDQVPDFAGKTRVVLVDLPGHGRSDKPDVDYTQDLFARGVHAALQDAGVKRAVLVGHSMGAPVIRQFYRRFPAETLALVSVDGRLSDPLPDTAAQKERLRLIYSPEFKSFMSNAIDNMFIPQTSAEIREYIKTRMMNTPQRVSAGAIKGLFEPGLWNEDPINVPMQAIMAKGRLWTPEQELSFRKLAPNVDYHAMEGVGHFLMMEQPAAFNALLAEFLKKNGFLKTPGEL